MANYIVPQVLINQLISEVPLNTVKNQNVLVIGPNYELFRFAEEKGKTYVGEYVNKTGQEGSGYVVDASGERYTIENKTLVVDNLAGNPVIPYPGQASGTIPDADYTKVYADEVLVKLFSMGSFIVWDDAETEGLDAKLCFPYALTGDRRGYATKLVRRCVEEAVEGKCPGRCGADGTSYWAIGYAEGSEPIALLQRDVNPGDAIRIPYEGGAYVSTIVSVEESVPGSGIFDCVQLADTLPEELLAVLEDYTVVADPDDRYSIEWTLAKCAFNAQDDESVGPVDPGSNDWDDCDSSEAGGEGGADTLMAVQLCAQFSDIEIARKTDVRHVWNWDTYIDAEVGNDEDIYGVVVTGNLKVRYSNWIRSDENGVSPEYRVLSAKLYVQHRDLITATASDIASISSSTLVEATLGTVHPDNPLAFGVYMAAINSGDRLVYFCGVPTDDLDGYNTVLGKASLTSEVYIICPTTMDLSVAQAVKSHVEEMSTAQNKLWRIGFVAIEPPAEDMIYDRTNNPSGEDFYAEFKWSKGAPSDAGANLIQFMKSFDKNDPLVNTTTRCLTEVQVGDVVRIWMDNSDDDWDGTPHYTERYVSKVVSNNVLQLGQRVYSCDFADKCSPDMIPAGKELNHFKVEVYRKLTPAQQVKYIADQSSQMATRRMYNVFPSIASNDGVQFDGSFLACAAAGLVSSVLPQQPVTNVAINGVNDIPVVYQTYTKAQLDTIAAGGTFIIMQDRPNSQVYVRHQISTDYTSNNLLKAELSITKNLDSISYYFAEVFAPYIGKYNITPELIEVLRTRLVVGLTALETNTAAGLYGPQVLAEGTEILYVRQSEVNKDHVEARVHLNLPVPFNYFDLDLEV